MVLVDYSVVLDGTLVHVSWVVHIHMLLVVRILTLAHMMLVVHILTLAHMGLVLHIQALFCVVEVVHIRALVCVVEVEHIRILSYEVEVLHILVQVCVVQELHILVFGIEKLLVLEVEIDILEYTLLLVLLCMILQGVVLAHGYTQVQVLIL